MGDGRGFDSDLGRPRYGDVAPDSGNDLFTRTNGEGQWRPRYGEVAPAYGNPTQEPDYSGSGRARYGEVAPAYGNPTQQPDYSGSGRPRYGEVAPAFPSGGQTQQPDYSGNGRPRYGDVAPAFPSGGTGNGAGGDTPVWKPKPLPELSQPTRRESQSGGNGLSNLVEQKRDMVERSLDKHVSFWGNNVIGGVSGGLWGGPFARGMSYGAKWYIANSDGMLAWVKATREGGAPVEGTIPKIKYGLASIAEKPIQLGNTAAKKYEEYHGVKTDNRALEQLQAADSKLAARVEEMAKKLEPRVAEIQQRLDDELKAHAGKLDDAVRGALGPEDLEKLKVRDFLRNGAQGEFPVEAVKHLSQTELEALQRYRGLVSELSIMAKNAGVNEQDLVKMFQRIDIEAKSASAIDDIMARLKPQFEKIAGKPESALTAEEQALRTAREFLEKRGQGAKIPAAGVLTEAEIAQVLNHQNHVNAVQELAKSEAFKKIDVKRLQSLIPESAEASVRFDGVRGRFDQAVEALEKKIADARAAVTKPAGATAEEAAILARYNHLRGTGKMPDLGVLSKEEAAVLAERAKLKQSMSALESELPATPRGFKGFMQNFAKGMLTVGIVQGIDDRLDRKLFGSQHQSSSAVIDSIVIPAAMLVPGGWLKKGAVAIGGHLLGKYTVGDWLDKQLGVSSSPSWSRFWRPNGVEAFAVAGAALIPMRKESLALRLGYIGAAWLGSHMLNFVMDGESARDKKDEAFEIWSKDKSERSFRSMNKAIDEFKDLGHEKEAALNFYLADWLSRKHDDLLNGYRGAAILFAAAGEVRLSEGTRVSDGNGRPTSNPVWRALSFKNNSHEYNNILAGSDLDLGGRALKNLLSGRISVDRAVKESERLASQGAEVRGTKVQASEAADLQKIGERIDASMNKIYGRHDMAEIYKELQEYTYKLNQHDVSKLRDQIKATIQKPGSSDPRYVAKFYRDLALIDLVFAGIKVGYNGVGSGGDGSTAAIFYQEAVAALREARRLDGGNQDLDQMDKIARDLSSLIPQKENAQWNSTVNNPLGVTR